MGTSPPAPPRIGSCRFNFYVLLTQVTMTNVLKLLIVSVSPEPLAVHVVLVGFIDTIDL